MAKLTSRELEVLQLVAQGLSYRQVSEALYITEKTVRSHMFSVLRKLCVRDRLGAVLAAQAAGLLKLPRAGLDTEQQQILVRLRYLRKELEALERDVVRSLAGTARFPLR